MNDDFREALRLLLEEHNAEQVTDCDTENLTDMFCSTLDHLEYAASVRRKK